MTPKITAEGEYLMLMALDGTGLTFTKMALGNGEAPDDYKSLTDLVNPVVGAEIGLDGITVENNYALLKGTLDNTALSGSFSWTEIGIFCKNPSDESADDILYAYGHYQLSDDEEDVESAVPVTKYSNSMVELTISVYVYVGDAENVTASLAESAQYATKDELNSHIEDTENPHQVTKTQVGLGNVPDVETNDQTPTYSAASSLSEMTSGEKLSTAFGKIAKAVSSLISHIANVSNPHGVTASQVGAAASSHNHSAANITSGTLSIARGGTGATTAEAAAHSLYAIYAGAVSSTYRIASGKDLNSYTTGGTYWCTSGSVAATLSNCPYTNTNFTLLVFAPSSDQTYQMLLPNKTDAARLYLRSRNSGTWGEWRIVTTTSV